jgi:GNAT superfamily N-acetyltransferase
MSEATPATERGPKPASRANWRVRPARREDLPAIGQAVNELLLELGGRPFSPLGLHDAARAVIDDAAAGVLLLAEADDGQIVGLLGASWQIAVRIPGRYGLIQELWVHREWRGRTIGRELLAALGGLARARGIERIEVGLPGERFEGLAETEGFYRTNGFTAIGMRMRRRL